MMYRTSFTGYESWLFMGFVWHHVLPVQRHLAERTVKPYNPLL